MRLPGGNTRLCMTICHKECAHTTVTFSRYILVWEPTLEQSEHTTEWARTLRFGAGLGCWCRCRVRLQGAAARCCCQSAVCALEPGCWCVAGCCCRAGAVAGAAAVASSAICCPGCRACFHFPSSSSGPEGPWWVGMPLSLVLASFWLRLFLLMLRLQWCCEQQKQHKLHKQQKE